jgi:ABC-type transporter Mla subunit MlaD
MSKPTRQVALAIAEADAALTVLKGVILNYIREQDRNDIDALIETAQNALDSANSLLADARHDAEAALDRL